MQPPSYHHSNRKRHNYLIYDIIDANLADVASEINGIVYDLGCGEAPYRNWILKHAHTYVGVDWSGSLHTLKADIFADLNEPLPIGNAVADTVISISVMEHLREPQQFLKEAYRILRPGGAMIMQVPFMWWVHEAPHDYFRYTRYGLKYMLSIAGFSDIDIQAQTGFWVTWTLKLNYQSIRLIPGAWPFRNALLVLLQVAWYVNQRVAVWLDRYWKCEQETAGYFIVAKKL